MKKILLFPFNGNATEAVSVIRDINRVDEQWKIIGFVDDDASKSGQTVAGYRVVGGREQFDRYPDAMVLAVPGRPETFVRRQEIIRSLDLDPERYANIVHPSASVGIASIIGHNVLIHANVVLTCSVSLGSHIVILPNTVLSHGTKIGDYSLIGSNVSISGNVSVHRNCYIGTGSKVIQDITIGEQALIGLGSVVVRDVNSRSVIAGNPARELKKR